MEFVIYKVFNVGSLVAAWYIWESYKISKRISIPNKVLEKLDEEDLEKWCNTRKLAKILASTGWLIYSVTHAFVDNNYVSPVLVVINFIGLGLIILNPIISVRNNNKRLGWWSSTLL